VTSDNMALLAGFII